MFLALAIIIFILVMNIIHHSLGGIVPKIKALWAILLGFGIQLMIFTPATRELLGGLPYNPYYTSVKAIALLHIISMFLLIFGAASNLKYKPAWLILIGVILNSIAIVTNGGYMPINPESAEYLHLAITTDEPFFRTIILDNPLFWKLGDWPVFILPPYYVAAFSIGDVMILVGIVIFLVYPGEVYDERFDYKVIRKNIECRSKGTSSDSSCGE